MALLDHVTAARESALLGRYDVAEVYFAGALGQLEQRARTVRLVGDEGGDAGDVPFVCSCGKCHAKAHLLVGGCLGHLEGLFAFNGHVRRACGRTTP